MKEWLAYFFGKGDTEEFVNFSFAHFAPILIAVTVILLIRRFRTQLRDSKWEKNLLYYGIYPDRLRDVLFLAAGGCSVSGA